MGTRYLTYEGGLAAEYNGWMATCSAMSRCLYSTASSLSWLASYSASSPPSRAAGKSKVFSPNSRLQDVGEGMKREFTVLALRNTWMGR